MRRRFINGCTRVQQRHVLQLLTQQLELLLQMREQFLLAKHCQTERFHHVFHLGQFDSISVTVFPWDFFPKGLLNIVRVGVHSAIIIAWSLFAERVCFLISILGDAP